MTDATFANLSTLVGELKQAAIDAYMKGEGWDLRGDKYEIDSRGTDFTVTRPGSDGQGGGDWEASDFLGDLFGLHSRDEEFRSAFDTIRERVDGLMERWSQVPDPAVIGGLVEQMRQSSRMVALSSVSSNGEVTGSSDIAGNLAGIKENSDAMAGGTISAFKSKFLLQLARCIGGHHAITMVLGGALSSQEGMWTKTREKLPHVVNNTKNAMAAVAEGGQNDWSGTFEVAGWVAKGVGIFTGGVTDPVVDGLEILKEATAKEGDDAAAGGGESYESVMTTFEQSLQDLADVIRLEEADLQANLIANLGNVDADRSSYDLSAASLLGGPEDPTEDVGPGNPDLPPVDEGSDLNQPGNPAVIIEPSLVTEITGTFMPAIAADLGVAAQKAYAARDHGAFDRDASIGIGGTGPTTEWLELNYLLYELIKNLEWEVSNGALTLDLAIKDLQDTDGGVRRRLEEQAERVGNGSIFEPWR